MSQPRFNPRLHREWVRPHSIEWYAQLGRQSGRYSYPWKSTITEPNGESIFTKEVSLMVSDKKVLDIGCGHGEYTRQWSRIVKHIVGMDITSDFMKHGIEANGENVSFVTANAKDKLPFSDEEFDCAYNRRGPTSAYLDLKRILKKGGQVIGIHPGDNLNAGLSELFPGFFEPVPAGTPVLDLLIKRLKDGGLDRAEVETVRSIEYLHEPVDIIRMSCFGQKPSVFEAAVHACMSDIVQIFEEHSTEFGLPTIFERYIVRVTI